jgi:hypothetical protein
MPKLDGREATKNEIRAMNAYNKTVTDTMKTGKKTPTSDYINLETYSPIKEGKAIDIEEAGKALDEADSEMLRESRKGKPPSTMDKIRSAVGFSKGGETFESNTAKRGHRIEDINTMSKKNSGLGSGNYDAYGDALDTENYKSTGKQTGGGGGLKKGGSIKSSASKRADGIAQRGHTKGKMR